MAAAGGTVKSSGGWDGRLCYPELLQDRQAGLGEGGDAGPELGDVLLRSGERLAILDDALPLGLQQCLGAFGGIDALLRQAGEEDLLEAIDWQAAAGDRRGEIAEIIGPFGPAHDRRIESLGALRALCFILCRKAGLKVAHTDQDGQGLQGEKLIEHFGLRRAGG